MCIRDRIRTHGTVSRSAVFKTAALNHSATTPTEVSPDPRGSGGGMVTSEAGGSLSANLAASRSNRLTVHFHGSLHPHLHPRSRFRNRIRLAEPALNCCSTDPADRMAVVSH